LLIAIMLLAAQAAAGAADDPHDCAPVRNMTAAGPPPPVFSAQRMETAPERRVYLSVHRCGEDLRIERRRTETGQTERDLEWVPVSQCAVLGAWVEAAARLNLPSPMLREHRPPTGPRRGTWFTLHARTLTGPGWPGSLELEILEPPAGEPSALSGWFREGERLFKACRDQGHGGVGYAPLRHRRLGR
jgi:hypothetical protein